MFISDQIKVKTLLLHYTILLVLIYFVVFFKLGGFPFRFWDESMFAVNAYEMQKNGNYMVPYSNNEVDWWNTKPLLLTWIQVGCIKLFGFNEFAIRLPSAMAVAFSILMLFHFLIKKVNLLFAWVAALILLTSTGYIGLHTGRTGDADALLSFFLLAVCVCYLVWLLESKDHYLFLALLFFGLAILTKSFAAFLIVPALGLFTIYYLKSNFLSVFKSLWFFAGLLFVVLSLLLCFYVRDLYQPGYLKMVLNLDAGRLFYSVDPDRESWDFYLDHIFNNRYSFWTFALFSGGVIFFRIKNVLHQQLAVFCLLLITTYLLIISLSPTKLVWYDMPLYPFFSVIAAITVYAIISYVNNTKNSIFYSLLLIALFFIPYRKMFFDSQSNKMPYGDRVEEMASLFLHEKIKQNKIETITVYNCGYKGSLLCYKYMYQDRGEDIRIVRIPTFVPGEKVFVSNDSLKDILTSNFTHDTLEVYQTGLFVQIK